MTLVETQHRLALEQLRRAGERPVSLAALRAAGLDSPAAVISELELLNRHAIERVHEHGRLVGLRLIEPEDADTGTRSPPLVVPAASIGGRGPATPGSFATPPQPPHRGHADPARASRRADHRRRRHHSRKPPANCSSARRQSKRTSAAPTANSASATRPARHHHRPPRRHRHVARHPLRACPRSRFGRLS